MASDLPLACHLIGCLTGCVWRGRPSIHSHYRRHSMGPPKIDGLLPHSDIKKTGDEIISLPFDPYI